MPVTIDFSSFAEAAGMLYTSAFLAERYAGIREFLESKVGSSLSYVTLILIRAKWARQRSAPLACTDIL